METQEYKEIEDSKLDWKPSPSRGTGRPGERRICILSLSLQKWSDAIYQERIIPIRVRKAPLSRALPFLILFLMLAATPLGQSSPTVDRALEKVTQRQDYLGALADLKKLLEASDSDPLLHYLIGVCYTGMRDYSKAIESFQIAHAKGLDSWELWLNSGIARARLGQDSRARKELARVLRIQPSEPSALFHLGRLDLKEGSYAEAEKKFRKVLSLRPDDRGALFSLGTCLLKQGREEEGREVLEFHRRTGHLQGRVNTLQLIASSPDASSGVFADLGNAYLELGDYEKAKQSYDEAERIDPGTSLTGFGRGRIGYSGGDLPAAERHLSAYLKQGGSNCEAYLLLGMVHRSLKALETEHTVLENGIRHCPRDTRLLANLAQLQAQSGQLAEMIQLAQKIIEIDSRAPAGPFFMALGRLRQNRLDEAETLVLEVLEINDGNPSYHRLAQQIYEARGATGKAQAHAEKVKALLREKR